MVLAAAIRLVKPAGSVPEFAAAFGVRDVGHGLPLVHGHPPPRLVFVPIVGSGPMVTARLPMLLRGHVFFGLIASSSFTSGATDCAAAAAGDR